VVPNVYLHSGEFHCSAIDLRIPGRGLDFVWARKYRSRLGPDTAQGIGWDFSYDIRIRQEGPAIRLFDGNTRSDLYHPRPGGIYTAREFFREGRFNPDNSFTLTFADAGTWNFKELDGSPAAGKIESIVDRNGNTLQLQYDGAGRLVQVIDTLGRTITVAYGANGRISSVTDFTGRTVSYAYYGPAEAGGSNGDLKSMTTPPVAGFPSGKKTTYTYSNGLADERLNHNLLTITDPKGQTWLANTYAPTTNRKDVLFDRIVRQRRGNPGEDIKIETELVMLSLVSVEPIKIIVNDRVGNVKECFFDRLGRMTRKLEFTGRANPALPTTSTSNRPVNPLRLDDPPWFETVYRYNADSLVRFVVHPNGNVTRRVYELALDPAAPWRTRGNLRELRRTSGTHVPAGDQAELVELFEYETGMGGCCGVSFVKRHVDARGNETLHTYDASGNRTHTQHRIPSVVEDWEYNASGQVTAHVWPDDGSAHRRRDEFRYYGPLDGSQNGYLKEAVVDAPGLALTTRYEYDAAGNLVRRIDPRGHDEVFVVNALNQVEAARSREWTSGSGIYTWKFHTYDANDNLVRVDLENRDENGSLQPNALLTTSWTHGILDEVLSETREVDAGADVVTEYAYDANRNRTLVRKGEATNGNQPANTETTLYDERDLVFRSIRAQGDAAQSTTQTDYDGNRNVRAVRAGLESGAHVTLYTYDGYDRRLSATDPMGNVTEHHYDANGNLGGEQSPGVPNPFGLRVLGELVDVPGSGGNVRLYQASYQYDALDRRVVEVVEHFDPATQLAIGDGQATTTTDWTDASEVARVVDDHGHATLAVHDTANRRRRVTDPEGNSRTWSYDANGNVVSTVDVDRSDLGNPDRIVTTSYVYDDLDRLVRHTDNLGNTTEYGYDSRNNRVRETDPRGNVTLTTYDGLDRLLGTDLTLTDTGTGAGNPIGNIVTARTWDDSSRLTSEVDGNGNGTQYAYDALDRRIRTVHADGTLETSSLDAHDVATQQTDANGSAVTSGFDGLDRLTSVSVVPGPGVSNQTTFESYRYDGLSRLVRAEDDDSLVTRAYDSLGNLIRDTSQVLPGGPVRTVSATHDALGNQTRLTYPGGRVIERNYDGLEREIRVRDAAPGGVIADSWFLGPTLERRDLANGTRLDASHDGVRRPILLRHSRIAGNVTLDQRSYGWDLASNKDFEAESVSGTQRLYRYDSANRLASSVELPAGTNIQYVLDDAGSRQQVIGGPNPGPYTCDGTLPEPADCQMNQYTTTPTDVLQHDRNGNLTRRQSGGDVVSYVYDHRNRPVQVTSLLQGLLAAYRYDCLARRIERSTPLGIERYDHDGGVEIETADAGGATVITTVWSVEYKPWPGFGPPRPDLYPPPPVDLDLLRRIDFAPGPVIFEGQPVDFAGTEPQWLGPPLEEKRGIQRFYFHCDDLRSVVLVTDVVGACVERARYGDFGETHLVDCAGNPIPNSISGNPYLYRSWRLEVDGCYVPDWRRYFPNDGRWIQRDPNGTWYDLRSWGNGLTLAGNNPVTDRPAGDDDPRPWVATVDVRRNRSGPDYPVDSFFDITYVVEFPALPVITPVPAIVPPPPPNCAGPCEGSGPVRWSNWVNANSWDRVKREAQQQACQASWNDQAEARAKANDACRASAGDTRCICQGDFQAKHGSEEQTLTPRWARQGMGFGKTPQVRYSCQLSYVGQCQMSR
jgi:YD repeat-containing protein